MNGINYQKVLSVNGELQALAVERQLEKAGVPVEITISHNGAYLDVLVPADCLFDAQNLLNPEPRTGEIFCVPSAV